VVTGTRAEYGLLSQLMAEIQKDKSLRLQVVVTGMHLSPEFGMTYEEIEKDGFVINKKVEILLSSDTAIGTSKAIGLGVISLAEAFHELAPNMIVILGDRFEALSAAVAAMCLCIPVAHIHGGESTVGVIDEAIRHSITKMSHLHFVTTEQYRNRVIQLGESPHKVFNVGSLGVHNAKTLPLLSKEEIQSTYNFKFGRKNLLVTFHPVTLEPISSAQHFGSLLNALTLLEEVTLIFTKPNADAGGHIISELIDSYTARRPFSYSFTNLGTIPYLSFLQFVDAVVGNSSSGIIEAPTFGIGTVNIGDRQLGRVMPISVLNCSPHTANIYETIMRIYTDKNYAKTLLSGFPTKSPYDGGDTPKEIKRVLKHVDLFNITKKSFYNTTCVTI
jgi:GDP/UDP-N,N'-diacetylbacillosamine 2-epimerase (hydrolysing)